MRHLLGRVVFIIASVWAGVTQADPTKSNIITYLESTLPGHFDVADLQFRAFASGNGTGRVSIAGHLTLIADIFVPVQDDAGIAEIFAADHNAEDVHYARSELPRRTIYRAVYIPDPTGFVFAAELTYQERVNGVSFAGRPSYRQLAAHEKTAATLPARGVVLATPAFDQYLNDVGRILAALRTYRENAQAAVGPLLAAGTATVVQDKTGERFLLRFQSSQGMSWEPRYPRRIHFGADASITWPQGGGLYNTGYAAGEEGRAYLRFDYLPNGSGSRGRLSVTLSIYDDASGGWYRSDGATYRMETDSVFQSPRGMSYGRRMVFGK